MFSRFIKIIQCILRAQCTRNELLRTALYTAEKQKYTLDLQILAKMKEFELLGYGFQHFFYFITPCNSEGTLVATSEDMKDLSQVPLCFLSMIFGDLLMFVHLRGSILISGMEVESWLCLCCLVLFPLGITVTQ